MKLIWFRRDLRLDDNMAIRKALESVYRDSRERDQGLVFVYLFPKNFVPSSASDWWLLKSLEALSKRIPLIFLRLERESLPRFISDHLPVTEVFWNRYDYRPGMIDRDRLIKRDFEANGMKVTSCPGNVFQEPMLAEKVYKVFTPFWKNYFKNSVLGNFSSVHKVDSEELARVSLSKREFVKAYPQVEGYIIPEIPKFSHPWSEKFTTWEPGEDGANKAFDTFFAEKLNCESHYATGRDLPYRDDTSRLSPHLAFGEISVQKILSEVTRHFSLNAPKGTSSEIFVRELGWRDFAYHIMHHFPETETSPLQTKFKNFPWRSDPVSFKKWCLGKTGYPLVDAGMRQLWDTGWMHNRVRMVVASFLVKHLLIDYRLGQQWFMETLVDADVASNTLGWQWAAGCGADAAPYFRVFNPELQRQKFDPSMEYCRKYIKDLDTGYCEPIIDLAEGRERALEALASIKESTQS